jgi:predicted DsbA family dithiol-disulfide isomerase
MGLEPLQVRVHYDFASSLCYVAHRVLGGMAAELEALGIALAWTPLDLAQLLRWPRGGPVVAERRANAERVARELGVEVRVPPVWLDSRDVLAAALALAGDPAREAAFRERVWSAVFEEGRDPGAAGAVEALGRDLGLDLGPGLLARARDELAFRTALAAEESVTGVPTLMLDEWPFGGIQTPETTRLVLARWASRKRARAAGEA